MGLINAIVPLMDHLNKANLNYAETIGSGVSDLKSTETLFI